MANENEALMKALKTAIQIEENGLETFLKFAKKTKDETGKNMFIQLALDEQQHRQILEKQLNKLVEDGQWAKVDVPKSAIEIVAPTIRAKEERIKGQSGVGELDALNTALDLEKKTATFFRDQAESVNHTAAKDLFNRLADWEDSHYDIIQAELDSINNTGFWFGIPEFQMDGKF